VVAVVVLGQLGKTLFLVFALERAVLELVPQLLGNVCFTLVVGAVEIIGIMVAMGRQIQAVMVLLAVVMVEAVIDPRLHLTQTLQTVIPRNPTQGQVVVVELAIKVWEATAGLELLSFVGLNHNKHPLPQQEALR
jgi:hypothetical protein